MANAPDLTVVAVFEDAANARAAANDLKAAGFGPDKVFMSSETAESYAAADVPASERNITRHHAGGITGWFKSLFGAHEEDRYRYGYETAHASGKTIVGVDTPEGSVERVSDILNRYSPVDVHQEDLGTGHGIATSDTTYSSYYGSPSDVLNARDELSGNAHPIGSAERGYNIPVVDDALQAGKRAVQRGGVRVHSRLADRPVEGNINLREERVRVDRQPVDRPAKEADFQAAGDQEIEGENLGANARGAATAAASGAATGLAGRTAGNYDTDYRQNFAATYPAATANYDDYAPAYRFGSDLANDPRYQGRNYNDVEPELREEYGRRYPDSAWDRMKDSVRYGWDRVTGKARSAATNR